MNKTKYLTRRACVCVRVCISELQAAIVVNIHGCRSWLSFIVVVVTATGLMLASANVNSQMNAPNIPSDIFECDFDFLLSFFLFRKCF